MLKLPSVKRFQNERGFTLTETLVSLMISSVVLSAVVSTYSTLTAITTDNQLKVVAALQAQSVIEMMTPDIRMLGNGVPFHQANFLIAQATLTDNTVTQPIIVDSTTESQIAFRLNESGETYIVTSDYNPAAGNTVALTSVSKIEVEDPIYITNATVADEDGLWGIVESIDTTAKTVTLKTNKQYSPSATFAKGSLLEVVPTITYTSLGSYSGITRDDGWGAQTLASTGEFTLSYLDANNAPLTLPLLASSADPFPASAIQNVHAVQIDVRVRTPRELSNGQYYIAYATQIVGIRNLNYKY